MLALRTREVLEGLGHHKRAEPVESRGHRGSRSANFGRQNLTHHQPGNGSEAQGESQNVDNEASEWQPTQMGHIRTVRLAVEEAAQNEQGQNHGDVGDI